MLSRTQVIVLAFVAAAWAAVVAILAAAPDVYDQALGLPIVDRRQFEVVFLAALSMFLVIVATGVVRRWRWMFWLILVAFLAGVIRLPASALELAGAIPHQGPAWYVVLQGVIGAVQFVIGIAMLVGYRRNGLWGNP
ncbi:MAG: hypothetical protein E6H97_03695 [Chloroflexi bacterium]|nr:MAG: hypothetical protein E6I77_02990 [Chloroflexota bacterium]TMG28927.1 MAG: hypothetical protein E6H97_03695 [Chloroflexota bacterium]